MKNLLVLDALVNLLLGILILLLPLGRLNFLGLPEVDTYFYSSILGAVIFGIGLALMLEIYSNKWRVRGLGIAGAIAINLCGGTALLVWLLFLDMNIDVVAKVVLWILCVIVLGVGVIELKSVTSARSKS
ncbi:MAG: hypothetical protein H8E26_08735 [FCB group bacterium]|nr:hypothetical protein [FCB group bacterium]MBL7028923.1 hypothetical protein [Candidatus Neomarinimicrobiota bacterium]MBL7122761.1 hypothetical protein [Candidatus Neomarinimicrobiota bacterium]